MSTTDQDPATQIAALKATEQPIDTGTAAGKAFLDMLEAFAEFETNPREERQAEGIAAAKARIDPEDVRKLAGEGIRPAHIACQLGILQGTVYRFLPTSSAEARMAVSPAADVNEVMNSDS